MEDSDIRPRTILNVAVPANEGRLRKHIQDMSATEACEFISSTRTNHRWLLMALERSRARLAQFDLHSSLEKAEKLNLDYLAPDEIAGMSDLGSQAPWIIFASSAIPAVQYSAVVGSRGMTQRGQRIVRNLVGEMKPGQGLVSGGANGIDLEAHIQARDSSLQQIVVLASGLDLVFPKRTADFIKSGFAGSVIAEMPPGVSSGKLGFLNRNRLIAAICKKLYLVEAPEVSGSINTAQHALSLNRKVEVCLCQDQDFSPGGRWFAKKDGVTARLFD
jgi:DNA processing protein